MLTAHVKSLKLKLKAQTHVATMGGAHFTLLLLYSYTYIMYIYIYIPVFCFPGWNMRRLSCGGSEHLEELKEQSCKDCQSPENLRDGLQKEIVTKAVRFQGA